MPRGLNSRVTRAAADAERIVGWPAREAAGRRALLRANVAVVEYLCLYAAPEDAGPGLSRALRMGEVAAAELAAIPDTPELRAADAALWPDVGPDPREELWRRLAQLAQRPSEHPPETPAEALARAIARAGGGKFPDYEAETAG